MKRFAPLIGIIVGILVVIALGFFLVGQIKKNKADEAAKAFQASQAAQEAQAAKPGEPAPVIVKAPPIDTGNALCDDANDVRIRVCMASKVDCASIMASADKALVEQINACPVTGPTVFAGESRVGQIPCCIPMDGKPMAQPRE